MRLPDLSKLQRWQLIAGGIAVALTLSAGWMREHDRRVRDSALFQMRYDELHRRAVIADAYAQAASARVVHDSVKVTKTIHRLDTLWRTVPETLRTSADTQIALASLPVLRRSTDSAIQSCSAYQLSCSAYRRATDSLITALRDENTLVRQQIGAERPGKLSQVREWAIRAGIAFVSFKVGQRLAK